MRDRNGEDESNSGGTEERQEPKSRIDRIHSVNGASGPVSRFIAEISESTDSTRDANGSNEARIYEETWLEPIDETSPKMRMAGPEPEKKEVEPAKISVVAWDRITQLLDKNKDPKKDKDNLGHFFDVVDRPMHYAAGSIECIDAIEAQLSPEEFRGYLKGNIIKYLWREKHKGGVESLKKAQWYLNRLIKPN